MALTVVIAYDVEEDQRRARLAALLQSCGDRIQYSVFLCRVDEDELAALLDAARRIIEPETDSIYALRQCATCREKAVTIGQARPPERRLFLAVL